MSTLHELSKRTICKNYQGLVAGNYWLGSSTIQSAQAQTWLGSRPFTQRQSPQLSLMLFNTYLVLTVHRTSKTKPGQMDREKDG